MYVSGPQKKWNFKSIVNKYSDAFYFKVEEKFFVYFSRILLALNLFVFAWILEKNNEKISNTTE